MIEENRIYCIDALEFLKQLPDKSVDLILTDPPYGMNVHKRNIGKNGGMIAKSTEYSPYDWDENIPGNNVFVEMFRVSKHQIIFGGNFMTEHLPPSRGWIVWDKDNGNGPYADCELAWTSFDMPVRKFRYKWMGMLQEEMKWKEKRVHPTQKPVALGMWILKRFGKDCKTICDPYAGSGTFLFAASLSGMDFLGCDINPDYVAIAQERLKQKGLL